MPSQTFSWLARSALMMETADEVDAAAEVAGLQFVHGEVNVGDAYSRLAGHWCLRLISRTLAEGFFAATSRQAVRRDGVRGEDPKHSRKLSSAV